MFARVMEKKYEIIGIFSLFSGMAGCYVYLKNKNNNNTNLNQ